MPIRRLFLTLCAIGVAAVITSAAPAAPPRPEQHETSKQLESLLKERRDTLRELVDILDGRYRAGAVTEEAVLRASGQLLGAELDLASTKAERIAIREKLVANLRRIEKVTEDQAQVGSLALRPDDVLQAKAARLKAEIQLLREKASNELQPIGE